MPTVPVEVPCAKHSTAWVVTTTLGFPTDFFIGCLEWSLNLTWAKSFEKRRQYFLILCWQNTASFPHTSLELWTLVFYPVMIIRVWFKTSELLGVLPAIKVWFDLGCQAATAQSLCILLQTVPPLYRFFQLTLLILFEEAEWGQFIAWKNIRPEEQQL